STHTPSRRFSTDPASPRRRANPATNGRIPTPCTMPRTWSATRSSASARAGCMDPLGSNEDDFALVDPDDLDEVRVRRDAVTERVMRLGAGARGDDDVRRHAVDLERRRLARLCARETQDVFEDEVRSLLDPPEPDRRREREAHARRERRVEHE